MPEIVQDARILAAARKAIDILLKFKGIPIVLTPTKGAPVLKPGGGHDFVPPAPRAPQILALSRIGGDDIDYSPNDEGANRKREYVMTGRYDAQVTIGDTFEDDEAEYTVNTVDSSSGFKVQATVTGWIKV